MEKQQVIDLMRSSKDRTEWDKNCDTVKKACGGYPDFWYGAVISSGLADEVLGSGASKINIHTFPDK